MKFFINCVCIALLTACKTSSVEQPSAQVSDAVNQSNKSFNLMHAPLDTAANDDRVFLLTRTTSNPDGSPISPQKSGLGTAWAALRKSRCVVTARHVITRFDASTGDLRIYSGVKPDDNSKFATVRAILSRGSPALYEGPDVSSTIPDTYTDQAVVWLTNFQRPDQISKYQPFELKKNALTSHNTPTYTPVTLIGYGPTDADGMREAERRIGGFVLQNYSQGGSLNPQKEGSVYTGPLSDSYATPCHGDSGGPVIFQGEAVASITGGDGDCVAGVTGYFTAVNSYDDQLDNWTSLHNSADLVCTKSVNVVIDSRNDGVKSVKSTILRPRRDLNKKEVNGKVECFPGDPADCNENIHEDMTITLTADVDTTKYDFHWDQPGAAATTEDGEIGPKFTCPCRGSTSLVCTMAYEDIGFYDATTSSDNSTCLAIAKLKGGSAPRSPGAPM